MTNPVRQKTARVYGGRVVRAGDEVRLLPPSLKGGIPSISLQDFNFLVRWLGKGPFIISWIGRWPCGKVMFYLKGAKSDEPGCYASDFM